MNAGQSSNDVFPTAVHLAAHVASVEDLLPALEALESSLRAKAAEFADVVKPGRTHLMDAVPVTLGQEFGGYARQVQLGGASGRPWSAWPSCRWAGRPSAPASTRRRA